MQMLHHVLTETSSSKGKFDLKGSATRVKILRLSCHILWLLSYAAELSKTHTHRNLSGPYLQKEGRKIISSRMSFFGTRPLYSNNSSQRSCPEDAKYEQLRSPLVVECSLSSPNVIRWFLRSLVAFKIENTEKMSFE